MARRKIRIDLVEMEKLYSMQCTDEEVAAFLNISTRTIERLRREKKFREVIERAKAKGKVSVRRNLFRLASNGNIAASIFLAKNLLLAAKPNLSQLTDDELQQLRAIASKALPAPGDRPGVRDAQPA